MLAIFYSLLNYAYRLVFGRQYMLHAPLFRDTHQTLFEAQAAFADHCISFLHNIKGTRMLDVGCGNGMQTLHILKRFEPGSIKGVDNVNSSITAARRNLPAKDNRISFEVDDAQALRTVANGSVDIVICLESALHYAGKEQFLVQVRRVLAPGGRLLIADLLVRRELHPGGIAARLSLHHWTHRQYLGAFEQQNIILTTDAHLNPLLLGQLKLAPAAIMRELRAVNRLTAAFKMLLIRPALALYSAQLKSRFEYRLFVGTFN